MKKVIFSNKDSEEPVFYTNEITYFLESNYNNDIMFDKLKLKKYSMASKYKSFKLKAWKRPVLNEKDTISLMEEVIEEALKQWRSVTVDNKTYKGRVLFDL